MDPDLEALARAHGVATWWRDGQRRRVDVDPDVVVTVLGLLGVDAADPAAARAARRPPGTLVARSGSPGPAVPGRSVLVDEDGAERRVDGRLPGDLAPGWYRLRSGDRDVTAVVAPPSLADPPRAWGWMLQLYALRSASSWGIGDLRDLREFVRWAGAEQGAGAVLVNPLHAITPTHPVQPSPYTPSSRRAVSVLALSVTDLAEYAAAPPDVRARVDALRPAPDPSAIRHDAVWDAKLAALELLWDAAGRPPGGPSDLAVFSALAERHGGSWRRWPAELRHPASPAVARAADPGRVAFHAWLQDRCAEQLASVRAAASGMAIGVVHDLAVGVDPDGADAWALQDVLADGVSVGAPPDAFNPHGQSWGLPPWRPDRLDATGYAAYRDMLRAVLAHADGVRVDHVAGLWRLWWVPPGQSPDRGTYVHYDAEAMLGVLALEAQRAGAVVVGEDLGTVEREVTSALAERNVLGCAVLWFTRDEDTGALLPPAQWPERALASISTHDLPTAAGFLSGEHVRVRAELGLLDDVPAEERRARAERDELVALLRAEGLLAPAAAASDEELVVALHGLLARARSRLRLASPYDVVGETRQPNLPGTVDEYPNWRIPLPLSLEELRDDPRVTRVVDVLRGVTEARRV